VKLIVGLGNPGRAYAESRHNIGFLCVRSLAKSQKAVLKKGLFSSSLTGVARLGREKAILVLPLTFMNLSGSAVRSLVRKYKIGLKDLLVISDDLDLEFGRLKIKSGGTSGGHRGLESIIENLKSRDFARLRLGIGRPGRNIDPADYVLSAFTKKEKEELQGILENASQCVVAWVNDGIDKSMNMFNKRSGDNE